LDCDADAAFVFDCEADCEADRLFVRVADSDCVFDLDFDCDGEID
jgi:hypothetical protein